MYFITIFLLHSQYCILTEIPISVLALDLVFYLLPEKYIENIKFKNIYFKKMLTKNFARPYLGGKLNLNNLLRKGIPMESIVPHATFSFTTGLLVVNVCQI